MAGAIATAFVEILPSTDPRDFQRRLEQELGPAAERAGRDIGNDVGAGIQDGAGNGARDAGKVVDKEFKGIGGRIKGLLSSPLGAAGAAFAGAFAVSGIVGGLTDAIGLASDLGETQSKVNQIFGTEAAAEIEKFASTASTALGQSKQAALDASATFGVFGKAAGLAGPDLAKFSTGLTTLSSDLASFGNSSPEEAAEALGAALRGEVDGLRRYGILLNEDAINAAALAAGIVKPTKNVGELAKAQLKAKSAQEAFSAATKKFGPDSAEAAAAGADLADAQKKITAASAGAVPKLTAQQKVLATQAAIFEQTADAQGDFGRTSGGLANQQRILAAQVTDLKTRLGGVFLPVVTKVVQALNAGLKPAVEFLVPLFSKAGSAIKGLVSAFKASPAFDALSAAFKTVGDAVKSFFGGIKGEGGGLDAVTGPLSTLSDILNSNVKPALSTLAKIFKSNVLPVIQQVGGFVQTTVIPALKQLGAIAVSIIVPVFRTLSNIFKTAVLPAVTQVASYISGTVVPTLLSVWQTIIANVIPVVKELANQFVTNILPAVQQLAQQFTTNVLPVLLQVAGIIRVVVSFFIKLAVTILGKVLPPFLKFIGPVLGGLIKIIGTVISTVFKFIGSLLKLPESVGKLFTSIKTTFTNIKTTMGKLIGEGVKSVVDGVKSLPGKIKSLGSSLLSAGKGLITSFINGFKGGNAGSSIIGNIKDALRGVINKGVIDPLRRLLNFKVGPFSVNVGNKIPRLARGAVVDKETLAVIGEAGPEVVIPLSRPARAYQLAQESGLMDLLASRVPAMAGAAALAGTGGLVSSSSRSGSTRTVINNNTFNVSAPTDDVSIFAARLGSRLAAWSER